MVEREELRRLLRQRPFQSFRVHVKDGRTYDVHFPEINLLGETYIDIGIPEPDNPDPFFDHTVLVPLTWVSRVELLPASTTPATT